SSDARRRAGRPDRSAVAGRRRSHRRGCARARRLRRATGSPVSRDARAADLRGCGARVRQGQSEEGVQGGAAAGVRGRRERAAVAGARRQAPQGLSLYLGIDLGASNIRSVIARDEQPIPRIVTRDERPTPRTGAAKGVRDFVYVTISTGIGGALVSGGRMLRGVGNIAGEIGHWPVALEGPRCGCGSYGCVESLAAGRFLAEAYGVDDAARVYAAAASGDPRAVAILARAEAALGNLAITLVNGLNPSLIVIGG